MANISEEDIFKLCSEDSLAPRELGGSLAPIGPLQWRSQDFKKGGARGREKDF